MDELKLPKGYEPYEILILCSNPFQGGQVPITVDGRPVFLLGKGAQTKVWLQVPTGKVWRYEITPEQINDSAFKVTEYNDATSVYFGAHLILRAEKVDDERIIVDHLDLTPFGLAINGDPTILRVGDNKFVGNAFKNVRTMINVK